MSNKKLVGSELRKTLRSVLVAALVSQTLFYSVAIVFGNLLISIFFLILYCITVAPLFPSYFPISFYPSYCKLPSHLSLLPISFSAKTT
jgi:hypothetical protein